METEVLNRTGTPEIDESESRRNDFLPAALMGLSFVVAGKSRPNPGNPGSEADLWKGAGI